jgi:hypothetical protein
VTTPTKSGGKVRSSSGGAKQTTSSGGGRKTPIKKPYNPGTL